MKTGWFKYNIICRGSRDKWEYAYCPYVCDVGEKESHAIEDWIESNESWTRGCEYFTVKWEVNVFPPIEMVHKKIEENKREIISLLESQKDHEKMFELLLEVN